MAIERETLQAEIQKPVPAGHGAAARAALFFHGFADQDRTLDTHRHLKPVNGVPPLPAKRHLPNRGPESLGASVQEGSVESPIRP
jgi:hypothetical protein